MCNESMIHTIFTNNFRNSSFRWQSFIPECERTTKQTNEYWNIGWSHDFHLAVQWILDTYFAGRFHQFRLRVNVINRYTRILASVISSTSLMVILSLCVCVSVIIVEAETFSTIPMSYVQ